MKKEEELEAVLSVFGPSVAKSAVHHESPDFLVAIPNGGTVGIEVTSLYESPAAAKLEKLDGYSMGLLNGTMSVHRSDTGLMEVGDVRLEKADGEFVDTVRAIIRPYSSLGERFSLLCARIDAKAQKTKELPIERYYRDARIYRIFDGTSEIHRTVVARSLMRHGAALFDIKA